MSNQRPGKFHKTAASSNISDASDRTLHAFFRRAADALKEFGHEDAAFYFEQVEDHLKGGGKLNDPIGKVLGV
jgi:hypothetical protein